VGSFNHGGTGTYELRVSNIGGANASQATTVRLRLPHGLTVRPSGNKGRGWNCHAVGHAIICVTPEEIAAAHVSTFTTTVRVHAPPGRTLHAIAAVSPAHTSPGKATATDQVTITS
jgi:uncharacterized repeat protein (TIGR01451 family)